MYIILITILLLLLYYKFVKSTKYWEERDVPHIQSWPIIGSMKDLVLKRKHYMDIMMEIYNLQPTERYVGFMYFTQPFLVLRDVDLIKRITIKDFEHFHDHVGFGDIKSDPLLPKTLLNLRGEDWKRIRASLSPAFTSNKLRIMFDLMTECADNFCKHFQGKEKVDIEMKEVFSRFANDVMATTAFGISVDSLEEPDNTFFKMGQKILTFGPLKTLQIYLMLTTPRIANFLQLRILTEEISNFFRTLIKDNIKKRETDGIIRPDLLHLLMEIRKGRLKQETNKDEEENFASVEESEIGSSITDMELTDELIVSQAIMFYIAGFETVSTVSSFMAHELALHPEIQKRLQNEIDTANENDDEKITYTTLLSMKYLDQVLCETLRMWPPGFQTERLCVKDYVIKPQTPKEKVVFVPKGSCVMIPVIGLHRDPRYYANPENFDPERFNDENKSKILSGTYLPFGAGPRNCIASRLALLEIKILFFHILSTFNIVPMEKTEMRIPLKVCPRRVNLAPENGFQLRLIPRAKR